MQKGDSYTLDSGSIFCSMYRMHNSSQRATNIRAKISVKRTPTSVRTLQIPNMNRNKRMVQNFGLFLGALQPKKTIRLTFFKRYGAEFDINSLYAIENLTGSLSAMKKKIQVPCRPSKFRSLWCHYRQIFHLTTLNSSQKMKVPLSLSSVRRVGPSPISKLLLASLASDFFILAIF
jgi:hypothetical protein